MGYVSSKWSKIEKGSDTKVSGIKSLVVQKQESKYSKVKHKKLPHPAQYYKA